MNLERVLTKLISFESVTGNREETQALLDWVKDELQPVPVHIREYEHNGLPSLVITPTRRKRVHLWLAAHVDVVAGPEELFTAKKTGKRLAGRGAIDMKFAVACYLRLLHEIGMDMSEYDIGVMLTPDEEWGSDSGVQYLLEKEGYTGDVVFLPDGYGSWKFEEKAKGILGYEVTALGIAAHGSKPWHGRSAIRVLCDFLSEAQVMVEDRFIKKDDEEHWYTTMNIGLIDGGAGFNIVAPDARATVDVRYVKSGDRVVLEKIFAKLQQKYQHIKLEITHDEKPYGILRKNGAVQTFARVAKEEASIDCGWMKCHGSSDARFFNRAGIPTILIGPVGAESHGDNEWIDVVDLERYYGILKKFVEEFAKK